MHLLPVSLFLSRKLSISACLHVRKMQIAARLGLSLFGSYKSDFAYALLSYLLPCSYYWLTWQTTTYKLFVPSAGYRHKLKWKRFGLLASVIFSFLSSVLQQSLLLLLLLFMTFWLTLVTTADHILLPFNQQCDINWAIWPRLLSK